MEVEGRVRFREGQNDPVVRKGVTCRRSEEDRGEGLDERRRREASGGWIVPRMMLFFSGGEGVTKVRCKQKKRGKQNKPEPEILKAGRKKRGSRRENPGKT